MSTRITVQSALGCSNVDEALLATSRASLISFANRTLQFCRRKGSQNYTDDYWGTREINEIFSTKVEDA